MWKPRPLRLWPVGSVFSSLTSLTQVHFSLSYLCVVSGSFSSPACVCLFQQVVSIFCFSLIFACGSVFRSYSEGVLFGFRTSVV